MTNNQGRKDNNMNYDRVILELLDRVSALEETVAQLKANAKNNANDIGAAHRIESGYEQKGDLSVSLSGKDTTKYIFEGKQYGKNRLVLAVIQKYVSTTPGISAEKLIATFDKSIQGSFGVVRLAKEVKYAYIDHERRFFFQPHEIIHTSTEDCVVCTQWGKFNIDNFLARAKQLGMHIQTVGGTASEAPRYDKKMNKAFAVGQMIGQNTFMELYNDELQALYDDVQFMSFITQLRNKLNGMELTNTKAANTEIMNAFFYSNIYKQYNEVADIVDRVKQYGKQASAHISIYYAMYALDFE